MTHLSLFVVWLWNNDMRCMFSIFLWPFIGIWLLGWWQYYRQISICVMVKLHLSVCDILPCLPAIRKLYMKYVTYLKLWSAPMPSGQPEIYRRCMNIFATLIFLWSNISFCDNALISRVLHFRERSASKGYDQCVPTQKYPGVISKNGWNIECILIYQGKWCGLNCAINIDEFVDSL